MLRRAGYEARAVDFLTPAFEQYPHREFCLLTLPHTAVESSLLRSFSLIPAKSSNTFGHVLYLLHRDSVGARLSVRWAEEKDTPVGECAAPVNFVCRCTASLLLLLLE